MFLGFVVFCPPLSIRPRGGQPSPLSWLRPARVKGCPPSLGGCRGVRQPLGRISPFLLRVLLPPTAEKCSFCPQGLQAVGDGWRFFCGKVRKIAGTKSAVVLRMVFCCFIGLSGRTLKKTTFFMQISGGFLLASNFWLFTVLRLSACYLIKKPKNAPLLRSRRPSLASRQFRAHCRKKTIQSKNHARRARFTTGKKPQTKLNHAH